MTVLQLDVVGPELLAPNALTLAVPGTYRVGGECVRIHKFLPDVKVRLRVDSGRSTCLEGRLMPRNFAVH